MIVRDFPTETLTAALRAAVPDGVDVDARRRAEYAADASNHRRVPTAVVFPRTAEQVTAALAVARAAGVPVTMRGGGTSIGGSTLGEGVVMDCSRHFDRILDIDPVARTARVEPGVVCDALRAAAAPHGLTFGPDPSSHSRATLGGMIGTNACGARSPAYGKTSDNLIDLDVVLADGTRLTVAATGDAEVEAAVAAGGRRGRLFADLRNLSARHGEAIRAELGRFPRQVSGYGLQHLLPDSGFDLARALVGSEGTCAVILAATVRLVPVPAARALLVLGFDDLAEAADAAPDVVAHGPLSCEGLDETLLPPSHREHAQTGNHPRLPDGRAWLLCEFGGDSLPEAESAATAAARDLTAATPARDSFVVTDPGLQNRLWRIREDAAGLATRPPGAGGTDIEAWPGWEDAAVPVANLGAYLRGFRKLLDRHGRRGFMYGHFGEGCIHARIDFDFHIRAGVSGFREFMIAAAELVAAHGGTLSGEHGDGLARSELLDRVYSPTMLGAFAEFKAAWDPDELLNPGVLVRPRRIDADLRVHPDRPPRSLPLSLAHTADDGDFARAARRCVGVGRCRQSTGGVMCPSYRATGDEKDSTRGRARVLQEMLNGELITDGWASEEVRDALDLCLACKGCRSDCPVGVDMATYKAEFLHQHFRRRARPLAHYSMGWLPVWARLAALAPAAANAAAAAPGLRLLAKRAAGVAPARELPRFAERTFRRRGGQAFGPREGTRVALWVDTFTDHFDPQIAHDAVAVLTAAGLRVLVPPGRPCCAITWIGSGQLDVARRVLRRTVTTLAPAVDAGIPVVGLEPSCTAALRSDLPELLGDDPRAERLAGGVLTLAETLERHAPDWAPDRAPGWAPDWAPDSAPGRAPTGGGTRVLTQLLTQVHCHQHAVLGFDADRRILERAGAETTVLDAGCCGLAGAFGFEAEHYDTSVAVAEHALLPALREAGPDAVVLADGFSCRTQVEQLNGNRTMHLAELLRSRLPARPG